MDKVSENTVFLVEINLIFPAHTHTQKEHIVYFSLQII